jgi:GntR family transcriptional regulator, transcriptional repressor for pyruvate dehydrogenase complex
MVVEADAPAGERPVAVLETSHRAAKVSELVARSIIQDIVARQLPAGTMLTSEAVMLKRYGVGRASLREALRILEIQGIIFIKPGPGGGPVVASVTSRDFGRMATMHYQAIGATFRDLVEARMIFEPAMAARAARLQDAQLIRSLRDSTRDTLESLHDDHEYGESAADFHGLIAGASANPILNLFGRSLKDVYTERVPGSLFPMRERKKVQADHEAIIDAIQRGDAAAAEELMRKHMDDFWRWVTKRYPALLDEVVDWR